jgi:hypothetical protein
VAFRRYRGELGRCRLSDDNIDLAIDDSFPKNNWFSEIYIQEVKAQRFKASFCF